MKSISLYFVIVYVILMKMSLCKRPIKFTCRIDDELLENMLEMNNSKHMEETVNCVINAVHA